MQFIDAQEMGRQHPKTFEVPSAELLDAIQVGTFVKVCPDTGPSERFWVVVVSVDGDRICGTISDDPLVLTAVHGLSAGDRIEFEKRHIYDVWIATSFINDDRN